MLLLCLCQSQVLESLIKHGLVFASHGAIVVSRLGNMIGLTVLLMLHDVECLSIWQVERVGATHTVPRQAGGYELFG